MNRLLSLLSLLLLLLLPQAGCVKRSLLIKSDPPGATAFINDREVGPTPVTVPFYHYGHREVRLEMDGRETLTEDVQIKAPIYQIWPIDFFYDVLSPKTYYDRRQVSFTLEPRQPVDEEKLLERGNDIRQEMIRQTGGTPVEDSTEQPSPSPTDGKIP